MFVDYKVLISIPFINKCSCIYFRSREAGLLPLCMLVEAALSDNDPTKRWDADRSLLAALVDRWRPETHTFHLPCGEVAPTLQDVSYLLGLPLAGEAVGPAPTDPNWKNDLIERFAPVQRAPGLPLQQPLQFNTIGPSKKWLLQFTVSNFVLRRITLFFMYDAGGKTNIAFTFCRSTSFTLRPTSTPLDVVSRRTCCGFSVG